MSSPLVSTIIPTHGRPQYLPKAIKSALEHQGDSVEVIIVPNGSDTSWKDAVQRWRSDPRVRVLPIKTAHANIARNHGKTNAIGKYIRFLDDDDALAVSAYKQIQHLEKENVDICVGNVDLINQNGKKFSSRKAPDTNDFISSVIDPLHVSLPHAYLFRAGAVQDVWWNEKCNLAQDKLWLYDICRKKEQKISKVKDVVGFWYWHSGGRITSGNNQHIHAKTRAQLILDLATDLEKENRLSPQRKELIASYLWNQIWCAYHIEPKYWKKMIDQTYCFSDSFSPSARIFQKLPFLTYLPPRLLYPTLAPIQIIRSQYKKLRKNK